MFEKKHFYCIKNKNDSIIISYKLCLSNVSSILTKLIFKSLYTNINTFKRHLRKVCSTSVYLTTLTSLKNLPWSPVGKTESTTLASPKWPATDAPAGTRYIVGACQSCIVFQKSNVPIRSEVFPTKSTRVASLCFWLKCWVNACGKKPKIKYFLIS